MKIFRLGLEGGRLVVEALVPHGTTAEVTLPADAVGGDAGEVRYRAVLPEGVALRQRIEDRTDELTTLPWRLLGAERTIQLADRLEPPCELLLARVDVTAGPNYQPASRLRS